MQTIIAIDVSKHTLMIYANGEYFNIENTEKSLRLWSKTHKALNLSSALFVYEATGGYERTLADFLQTQAWSGHCVHANHVRAYAKALGILAKTDKLDAKVIAEFAQARQLAPKAQHKHSELLALVQRREQLLEQYKQEMNRLETLTCKTVIRNIQSHGQQIKKYLKELKEQIKAYVEAEPKLAQQVKNLTSIPGVGFITGVSILAYLPEINSVNDKALTSLVGLAPMNKDSGQKTGKRKIQGGRASIRRVLYMATLTAKRYNSVIKEFFERLSAKGKAFKVAMTAAMRKLLLIIRSVAIRQTPWESAAPIGVSI